MKALIGFCGLNCETCEARIATVNCDEALREKVAKHWSELNAATITPDMIHCTGCRVAGPKTPYCETLCPIRKCAMDRGMETCGSCGELDDCGKVAMIFRSDAEARRNLSSAR